MTTPKFDDWHKEHAKYMGPVDIVHWCAEAYEAGKLEQAAQIEMMREVQIDAGRYRWLRNALSDRSENGVSHHFCSIRTSEELDIEIDKASKKKPCSQPPRKE